MEFGIHPSLFTKHCSPEEAVRTIEKELEAVL